MSGRGKGGKITLPSEVIYDGYGRKNDCSGTYGKELYCKAEIIGKVETELKRGKINNDQELANKIVKNYYTACTVRSELSYYKPCYFLFFWICTEIGDKLGKINPKFGYTVDDIYKALQTFPWKTGTSKERECINIYPQIMEFKCKALKKFYDYNYNIEALKDKQDCNKYLSDPQYGTDRQNAQQGYSLSCAICTSDDIEYCKEFRKDDLTGPKVEVKAPKLDLKGPKGQVGPTGESETTGSSTPLTTIIPPAIGGVVVPAIAYLLYKVITTAVKSINSIIN
ncbi:Uncharacterized protein PCOAH_00000940 [Plasmodium coatneyi]|uniref:KIR protein n=1 Tax=Plasmodium coatneyi TaxID=208452 RepID=A0A1B1DSE5_9APIC|nr:Uncharacterized protein PCOAH_00000940 [Plasmodium coatneyi]ANQ05706.1 Uncharacterized protein PCOAH_00000940 [Plasmodium coatneyi]